MASVSIFPQSGQVVAVTRREETGVRRGGLMTTLKIELPDELAEEARTKGPLAPGAIQAMIRVALRRSAAASLFEAADKPVAAEFPHVTEGDSGKGLAPDCRPSIPPKRVEMATTSLMRRQVLPRRPSDCRVTNGGDSVTHRRHSGKEGRVAGILCYECRCRRRRFGGGRSSYPAEQPPHAVPPRSSKGQKDARGRAVTDHSLTTIILLSS